MLDYKHGHDTEGQMKGEHIMELQYFLCRLPGPDTN